MVGTSGSAQLRRGGWAASPDSYTVASKVVSSSGETETSEESFSLQGVHHELREFHSAISQAQQGEAISAQKLGSAAEAFTDLAMVSALLKAAEAKSDAAGVEAVPI